MRAPNMLLDAVTRTILRLDSLGAHREVVPISFPIQSLLSVLVHMRPSFPPRSLAKGDQADPQSSWRTVGIISVDRWSGHIVG